MINQLFSSLGKNIETWAVGFLLLYFWDVHLPPFMPSFLNELIKAGSYVIVASLIIGRWKQFIYVATRNIPLLLLIGIALMSVFWSAAPEYTSDECKAMLRASMFGVFLARRYSPKRQMQLFTGLFGIAALVSLTSALALPAYGIGFTNGEVAWKGIFAHKQYLGRIMTMAGTLFLIIAFSNKRYHWFGLIGFCLAVVLLVLSKSKSSLILFLFSLFLMPLFKLVKQYYKLQVFLYIVSLILVASAAILILSNLEFILVDSLGKDLEFNGRVPVWTLAIEKGLERPWLGYGYAGFWTSDESSLIINSTWAGTEQGKGRFHAHNGLIDLFLELGLVGLLLFMLSFLTVLIRLVALMHSTKAIEFFWMLQSLLLMFLFNFIETKTIVSTHSLWTFYVATAFSVAVECKRIKNNCSISTSISSG